MKTSTTTDQPWNLRTHPPIGALAMLGRDAGQGVAEYAIILAVIVVGAIALATAFSTQLGEVWSSITTQMATLG